MYRLFSYRILTSPPDDLTGLSQLLRYFKWSPCYYVLEQLLVVWELLLPLSQFFPVNPDLQVHLYVPGWSEQAAPFWQGFLVLHSSIRICGSKSKQFLSTEVSDCYYCCCCCFGCCFIEQEFVSLFTSFRIFAWGKIQCTVYILSW